GDGRALFAKTCAACHRLFGEGGTIGPDLTGSNRNNLDYLLENIVDPSAVVNKDYRMTILQLTDGRVLNGLVLDKNDRTTTLRTATEQVVIENSQIEASKLTPLSPMPDGLLGTLTAEQVRDLFAYLQTPVQVPLPEVTGAAN
ncbi:MAG: c-type cytochrome, partial [Planctomycetaceae bacterium]|nr:c-type cytochrome [Planctomycetaceae bacterium]